MASKKPAPKSDQPDERPDAWDRFEKAVDAALHTSPKHRPSPDKGSVKER